MMTDLQKKNGPIFVWYRVRVYHEDIMAYPKQVWHGKTKIWVVRLMSFTWTSPAMLVKGTGWISDIFLWYLYQILYLGNCLSKGNLKKLENEAYCDFVVDYVDSVWNSSNIFLIPAILDRALYFGQKYFLLSFQQFWLFYTVINQFWLFSGVSHTIHPLTV